MNVRNIAILAGLFIAGTSTLAAQAKVFAGEEDRKLTRVFYYSDSGGFIPKGQVYINYGSPTWQASHDEQIKKAKGKGMRWRCGSGAWTTLDTNVELDFGGTKVKPGSYYLVLEKDGDDKMHLVLLNPADMRKKKYDAFQAGETKSGTKVPMAWKDDGSEQKGLKISLTTDKKDVSKITLTVAWGKHRVVCNLTADLG